MALPLAAIGMAVGAIGSIGKMFGRGAANRRLRNLAKNDPQYQINPEAQKRLGLASTLLNARSPGAMAAERNIQQNQANTLGRFQRGATSSSQLLSLGADAQAQTNQDFNQLEQQETADYQRRYGNLEGAQQGMIQEGDKLFQDKVRRHQNQLQVEGAINENRQNNWGDIAGMGFGLASFAMSGGMGDGKPGPPPLKGPQYGSQPYISARTPMTNTITPRRP